MRNLILIPLLILNYQKFSAGQKVENFQESNDLIILDAFVRISQEAEQWADSIMATLTPDERIAQLFMVSANSNKDERHYSEIEKLVGETGIGGLIFFQGGPGRQASLTNRFQSAAKVKMFMGSGNAVRQLPQISLADDPRSYSK